MDKKQYSFIHDSLNLEVFPMLFRKKIARCCSYCVHCTTMEEGLVLCSKRGVKRSEDRCFRFRYDPCKRIPPKPKALDFSKYESEDFSL